MNQKRSDQSWMDRHQPSPHDSLDASGSYHQWRTADKRRADMLRPAYVAGIVTLVVALVFFAASQLWLPLAIVSVLGICLILACLITGRSQPGGDA